MFPFPQSSRDNLWVPEFDDPTKHLIINFTLVIRSVANEEKNSVFFLVFFLNYFDRRSHSKRLTIIKKKDAK